MMHGYFGTIGVWILYILGQVVHIAADANDTINDQAHAISSWKVYFKTYGTRLIARFFLTMCMFPLVWNNPALLNFERFMSSTGMQIGVAGIFGYFSDSAWDHLLSFLPWLQKKLPQVPGSGA